MPFGARAGRIVDIFNRCFANIRFVRCCFIVGEYKQHPCKNVVGELITVFK